MRRRREWPSWWQWEIGLNPHLLKRMEDRAFGEVELREMLEKAVGVVPDIVEGRWRVETRHAGRRWEVIVEPAEDIETLIIVTAYPVWSV
ncbi:MAG: hypothetical protein HC897_10885 [Thermoanaerobaculia bacterium]|nr:hypothetical protein [Thermoanaerobaculia bacterium]